MNKRAPKLGPELKKCLCALIQDERGQSTTEYILMLAVVVMIAMKFKETFLGKMKGIVDGVSGNIEKVVTDTQ